MEETQQFKSFLNKAEAQVAAVAERCVRMHSARTCFVLFASSAGLLDKLAPAALLLSAGRNTLGRSNRSICNLGKPLYLEEERDGDKPVGKYAHISFFTEVLKTALTCIGQPVQFHRQPEVQGA